MLSQYVFDGNWNMCCSFQLLLGAESGECKILMISTFLFCSLPANFWMRCFIHSAFYYIFAFARGSMKLSKLSFLRGWQVLLQCMYACCLKVTSSLHDLSRLQVLVFLSDCISKLRWSCLHYSIPYEILNLFTSLRVYVFVHACAGMMGAAYLAS